ncbi:nicotinate-nucleotide--dimethylbenzimidazole phosphoribosyltransferase [Granulosicoccaceae sp. 1_MG-2023]|nr:nicotinate-nucleotide--dimethylbenzimidazole phosphoribosyltransferase [Granulosicoccaceae sp. 1_MG-2023]
MKDWTESAIPSPDRNAQEAALARQNKLTKPPGSLGRLEDIAVHLAALQDNARPQLRHIAISVFAADHGIAADGVSAFPQAVTAEMVRNFSRGGAAIGVLAKELQASLEVVNLGTVCPIEADLPGVVDAVIAPGTASFRRQAAMTEAQLDSALAAGKAAAERAAAAKADLFIGGEMGIGNTTSSAAIYAALLDLDAAQVSGPGTGLDEQGVQNKTRILQEALAFHGAGHPPRELLRRVGGFEIAALTGAYLRCAQLGIPALVDGFITTAAAMLAVALRGECRDWLLFSHRSAEPAHHAALEQLQAEPLLDLHMRLGEGSGAAVAAGLMRHALALHNGMATFDEAGVSGKS